MEICLVFCLKMTKYRSDEAYRRVFEKSAPQNQDKRGIKAISVPRCPVSGSKGGYH